MAAQDQGRGFASDVRALADNRAAARLLVGQRIVQVAYVDIDYRGLDLDYQGQYPRRAVTDAAEWSDPTWDAGAFHHLDFGIELTTDRDETWGITWDSPSPVTGESIRLQRELVSECGAVWDVTGREPWRPFHASPISDVALRYHRWSDDSQGFWCTRVSLSCDDSRVEVLMGDRDSAAALTRSADNLAVLLDTDALPPWERTDDLV